MPHMQVVRCSRIQIGRADHDIAGSARIRRSWPWHDLIINFGSNDMWLEQSCPVCRRSEARGVVTIDDQHAPGDGSHVVRCLGCGLRRLDRRPSDSALAGYYLDSYNSFVGRTRGPLKQRVWNLLRDFSGGHNVATARVPTLRRLAYRATSRLVDVNLDLSSREEAEILDVGCGYGDLLLYFSSRGYGVRGVEGDSRAVERAAELGLRVELEDPAALSLPSDSIDVTIFCHSLEHLPGPLEALEEAARVSKPNAEIHIAVPNGDAAGLQVEGADWGHLSFPLHFWYFDARSLVSLLTEAGLRVQTVSYRMTWGFHVQLWRKQATQEGPSAALMAALSILRRVAASPNRKDVLRVVAVKPA